jgi:D-sedoheptulose 7-phosphate isomerase
MDQGCLPLGDVLQGAAKVRHIDGATNFIHAGVETQTAIPNVLAAMKQARLQQMKTIGLSCKDGSAIAELADISISVNSDKTARIQECHIAIGHLLCELAELDLFEGGAPEVSAKAE